MLSLLVQRNVSKETRPRDGHTQRAWRSAMHVPVARWRMASPSRRRWGCRFVSGPGIFRLAIVARPENGGHPCPPPMRGLTRPGHRFGWGPQPQEQLQMQLPLQPQRLTSPAAITATEKEKEQGQQPLPLPLARRRWLRRRRRREQQRHSRALQLQRADLSCSSAQAAIDGPTTTHADTCVGPLQVQFRCEQHGQNLIRPPAGSCCCCRIANTS